MDKYKKDFLKSLQHQLLEQTENDDPNPRATAGGHSGQRRGLPVPAGAPGR